MCQPGTHRPTEKQRLHRALRLDLLGERWQAICALEKLLKEHPDFHEARGHLAWIYSLQGNLAAAVPHLRQIARAETKNQEVTRRIAELETEFETLSQGASTHSEVYELAVRMANDPSRQARFSQRNALVLFRRLWEEEHHADSAIWVSRLSHVLQDYPTCLRSTRECLDSRPDSLELRKRLGVVLEKMGMTEDAVRTYREILEKDPRSWGTLANLIALGAVGEHSLPADYPLSELFTGMEKGNARKSLLERIRSSLKKRGLPWRKDPTAADRAVLLSKRCCHNPDFLDLPCNLCGGTDFSGIAIGRENGWPIMRCLGCGLIQTHPQPTQETLLRKYREQYYGESSIEMARGIHEAPPVAGTFLVMLPRVMDFLLKHGLEEFERSRPRRRLLDVGCGEGVLMRDFKNRGWDCEGTEVSNPAIGFLRERGYRIHEGAIENLELSPGQYDLITLSHVIEHLRDPLGCLKRLYPLLKRGGWLFVTTPGADSLPCRIAGEDWFYDPDHIFFFSRSTLRSIVKASEFHVFGEETYVGAGRETWEGAWLEAGLGPSVKELIEERGEGDVLLLVARKE